MRIERISFVDVNWTELDSFEDRTIYQTKAWLEFLVNTQRAEPVVGALIDGATTVGFFTGAVVRKFGMRFLGSPFPGWTTSYMGFNLLPEVSRKKALDALTDFAFRQLRCIHVEIMDRRMRETDAEEVGYIVGKLPGYELDLTKAEDCIFADMKSSCRRAIRRADKNGVTIEEASDRTFIEDYYSQLEDVFAKQTLVPTYKKERVQALFEHLHPSGNLLLLRAMDQNRRCVATGIFPAFNDTAYFWGGASWRASQILRPNEAIHWYAIRYWKNRGILRYDMGGGGGYKEKYGGMKISIPWVRKSKYEFFANQRQRVKKLYRFAQERAGRKKVNNAT